MSVVGIVSEYNPFHNGHLYNLKKALDITNSDTSVCVMSSNFTQRGIPAIVDKWTRTRMALSGGLDLVIELPCIFSMESAQYFCDASIKILNSLGVIDYLCFGSECGDLSILNQIADILYKEPEEFKIHLKSFLSAGLSYPAARMNALKELLQNEEINNVITEPNNILGIEYIIALKKYKSNIVPKTIQRIKAAHNSKAIESEIASASAIRSHIFSSSIDSISQAMPEECFNILNQNFKEGLGPVYFDSFSKMFLYKIRTSTPKDLANILEVSEGLENKILKEAMLETDIKKIVESIKSKRYTMTRIHRIFLNILLDVTKDYFEPFKINGPSYIRLLGFSTKGQALLKKIKENSTLPLLSNLSDSNKYNDKMIKATVDFEVKASNVYYLALDNLVNTSKISGFSEYSHKIIKF